MNEAQANEQVKVSEPPVAAVNVQTAAPVQQTLNVEMANAPKLTPEMEEEAKFRMKYPNPQKPGGSAFIQKMLHRGSKKYFDSGDYNMAQSRKKAIHDNNKPMNTIAMTNNANIIQSEISVSPVVSNQKNSETLLQTPGADKAISSPLSTTSNMSPIVTGNENNLVITTPIATNNIDKAVTTTPVFNQQANSQNITPLANNNQNHHLNHHYLNTTHSNTVSPLSSSISSNNLLNPHYNHHQMPTSMSTQSISMLSSSISTDRLSNIQLNPTNPTCILDNEEIGHAIPTPECLPQSRKHSIVQSKLATPRLSSS